MAGPISISIVADARQANRAMDQTASRAQRLGSGFRKAAIPATAALGGLAVGAFKAAQAAAEDDASQRKLAQTLTKSAKATAAQVAQTEDYISKQGQLYGTTDDELRPALAKLVVATKDVGKAQKLASLAQDIAAARGVSLESVTKKLANAQNGSVAGLKALGIKTQDSVKDSAALQAANIAANKAQDDYTDAIAKYGSGSTEAARAAEKLEYRQTKVGEAQAKTKKTTIDFAEAQKRLAQAYSGAAADSANTAAGQQKRLNVQIGEFQEQLGALLLPLLSKVTKVGLKFVGFLAKNETIAKVLIGTLAGVAAAVVAVNIAMSLNPAVLLVAGIAALVAALVVAYKRSEEFRRVIDQVGAFIRSSVIPALQSFAGFVVTQVVPAVVAIAQRVAQRLQPAFAAVAGFIRGSVVPAVKQIVTKFREWQPTIQRIVLVVIKLYGRLLAFYAAVLGKVIPVVARVAGVFLRTAVPAVLGLIGVVVKVVAKLADLARRAVSVGTAMVNFGRRIVTSVSGAVSTVREKFTSMVDFIKGIPGSIGGIFDGLWGGVANSLKSALNNVLNLPLRIPRIDTHIPGVGKVGGQTLIPALAKGGIVNRPTLALIGEAGPEAVVPLDRYQRGGGGNTITVNVYPSVGSSPAEIGREIRRCLTAFEGSGGRKVAV